MKEPIKASTTLTTLSPLSRLVEFFPYPVREMIEKADLEIRDTCLHVICSDAATRNNLHQQIESMIAPICWMFPQVDMLSLEAPNVRKLPIPVSLALVNVEDEILFPAGTRESQQILSRRIEAIKLCEIFLSISRCVVFVLDQDGAIVETNATKQTYAVSREDAIGRLAAEVCPTGDRVMRGIQEAYRLGRRYRFSVDRVVMGQSIKFTGESIPCQGGTIVVKLIPDPIAAKMLALH